MGWDARLIEETILTKQIMILKNQVQRDQSEFTISFFILSAPQTCQPFFLLIKISKPGN